MEAITIKQQAFKSKELNTATSALAKALTQSSKSYNEACKILARVEAHKAYKEDGFNSLAEYAEKIGLAKSTAHKMENAGRMMISENPVIAEFATKADWSKLAMLSSEDEKKVEEAIKSGEITEATTSEQVNNWKKKQSAENAGAKVLPNYDVDITFGNGDSLHIDNTAIEAIEQLDGFVKIGVYKEENKPNVTIMYNPKTGGMCRYTAERVKKVAPKKPQVLNVKNFTNEMLEQLMAEYNRRKEAGE